MKKLLLSVVGGALSLAATAQSTDRVLLHKDAADRHNYVNVEPRADITEQSRSAHKTTASDPRWYVPYDIIDALNSGALDQNRSFVPIWFDSTVRQRFTTGMGTINYISLAQIIDPIGAPNQMFNDPSFANQNIMTVQNFNSYTVDSVIIVGAYVKVQSRPTSVVDTLIFSVAPSTGSGFFRKATSNWITNYTSQDSLVVFTPRAVDSANRAAFSEVGSGTGDRRFWKVPLTDAERDTVNTQNNTITVRTRTFAVPNGGLQVPAGARVAMTVTFKSGDTWTPNVDSFNSRHHYRPQTAAAGASTRMVYNFYAPLTDRNHSSLMFSTDTSFYGASYAIEGTNTIDFRYEHHAMGVHVVCPTCWVLDVKNTEGLLEKGGAYPNPAVTYVKIPFQLSAAANVNVTLTNAVGQVVRSERVENTTSGEVTFNTANLTNGLYLYTIEANGQRTTGRVTVAH